MLTTSVEAFERLRRLQVTFASVCNSIAPVVSEQRCWNRVALHHLVYRRMREEFPELGSQMVCNAIYAVCKVARIVYQHPKSPFHYKEINKLPQLKFMDTSPVFFDWHTLSLGDGKLSIFTLDGRMKFPMTLSQMQRDIVDSQKLVEIAFQTHPENLLTLTFKFRLIDVNEANTQEESVSWPLLPKETYVLLPQMLQEIEKYESTTNAK